MVWNQIACFKGLTKKFGYECLGTNRQMIERIFEEVLPRNSGKCGKWGRDRTTTQYSSVQRKERQAENSKIKSCFPSLVLLLVCEKLSVVLNMQVTTRSSRMLENLNQKNILSFWSAENIGHVQFYLIISYLSDPEKRQARKRPGTVGTPSWSNT